LFEIVERVALVELVGPGVVDTLVVVGVGAFVTELVDVAMMVGDMVELVGVDVCVITVVALVELVGVGVGVITVVDVGTFVEVVVVVGVAMMVGGVVELVGVITVVCVGVCVITADDWEGTHLPDLHQRLSPHSVPSRAGPALW